jgi:hypothetical protein
MYIIARQHGVWRHFSIATIPLHVCGVGGTAFHMALQCHIGFALLDNTAKNNEYTLNLLLKTRTLNIEAG